jgi:hypothetical protein
MCANNDSSLQSYYQGNAGMSISRINGAIANGDVNIWIIPAMFGCKNLLFTGVEKHYNDKRSSVAHLST